MNTKGLEWFGPPERNTLHPLCVVLPVLTRDCSRAVLAMAGQKTRYPNPKNPSPNPKSPNLKNPNPNSGSNPRYPKLIRVVRVLGHGTRNTRTTRNDLFFHLWFDLCASKLCLLIVICEVWTVTVWTCEVLVNFVWTVSLDVWTGCMVGCIWFDFILHMWSSRISGNSGKTRTRTRIFGYPNFRVLLFPNWFRVSFFETRNS